MNILVITKRQYTGKDLLSNSYGRLFEIPAALSELGHNVSGIAFSYRPKQNGVYKWEQYPNLTWHSINAFPTSLIFFTNVAKKLFFGSKPDIIWASSDMIITSLSYKMARKLGIPIIIDLYDNYESFSLSRLPGLKSAFKKACQNADGVTTVSQALSGLVKSHYKRNPETFLIPNAAKKSIFFPRKKSISRSALGLPNNATIIGTAGSLTKDRGIEDLIESFLSLSKTQPNLYLAVAGPSDETIRRHKKNPNIINFGTINLNKVPLLLASLDVVVICNKHSDFGSYCSPLKLMETLAMNVPFVAASTGDTYSYLKNRNDCLYTPGDTIDLCKKIQSHLKTYSSEGLPTPPSWKDSATKLEKLMKKLTNDN